MKGGQNLPECCGDKGNYFLFGFFSVVFFASKTGGLKSGMLCSVQKVFSSNCVDVTANTAGLYLGLWVWKFREILTLNFPEMSGKLKNSYPYTYTDLNISLLVTVGAIISVICWRNWKK